MNVMSPSIALIEDITLTIKFTFQSCGSEVHRPCSDCYEPEAKGELEETVQGMLDL